MDAEDRQVLGDVLLGGSDPHRDLPYRRLSVAAQVVEDQQPRWIAERAEALGDQLGRLRVKRLSPRRHV